MHTQARISHKDFFTSALFAVISAGSLAFAAAAFKAIALHADLHSLLLLRFVVPFLMLTPCYFYVKHYVTTATLFPNACRVVCIVLCQVCLMYMLLHANLLLTTLLFSTHGLYMPFISRILFGAALRVKTIVATLISFIGIAVVIGPVSVAQVHLLLIGLASGLFSAGAQSALHYVSKRQSSLAANWFMYGLSSLLVVSFLPMQHHYQDVWHFLQHLNLSLIGLALLAALFSIGNQMFRAAAYKRVNHAASLSPFLYVTILISGTIDWLWLGIIPSWHTYLGGALILLGAAVMAVRKIN